MKILIFISLMAVSGCAITPETTKRIAKENARFNDRICGKIDELHEKKLPDGIELIKLGEYVDLVNFYAKKSYSVIECE